MKFKCYILVITIQLFGCNSDNKKMNESITKNAYSISKSFSISPERLFSALTDSAVLKKIWGVQRIYVDARVGGKSEAVYIEGNTDWSFTIIYKEVIKNEKLKWVTHFKSFPEKETQVTMLFNKADHGSELIINMSNFESEAERDANKGAWEKGLNVLDEILKKH